MPNHRLDLLAGLTPAIWIHLIAALLALILGAVILFRRKGTKAHRFWGWLWVALMAVAAVSSFFISTIRENGFSPIHALSVYTLFSLVFAIRAIRAGRVDQHRKALQTLYAAGLLIAGGFTFLPPRLLGRLSFGETLPWANLLIVAAMVGGGIFMLWRIYRTGKAGHAPDA